ncbi:MAG: cytochrome c [Acidimicrobiia bacterium]
MKTRSIAGVVALALIVGACAADTGNGTTAEAVVGRGGELYQQYCAQCHGADLSGDPNWKTPNDDGSYPPPPHDSSGHTWHHPDRVLFEMIRDGSDFPQSGMTAFGGRLNDEDIEAILAFIKSKWGPEERAYQQQVTGQDQARAEE